MVIKLFKKENDINKLNFVKNLDLDFIYNLVFVFWI